MIRITTHNQSTDTVFLLEGKLAGDSVTELEKCWRIAATNTCVSVDLTAVDFIDTRGKQLLAKMFKEGARLLSKGLMARCIIEEIEDEGPGLSNTSNLFVPFFTTKPGGSGIGLVLSRQIVEAHGGSLRLENRPSGHGCIAHLRLPM